MLIYEGARFSAFACSVGEVFLGEGFCRYSGAEAGS
jgi:hypothetical protein